jgi:FG-GAP-like repeat
MRALPPIAALVLLTAAASWTSGADRAFPSFERHRIDAIGTELGQTALADIDKDGDLDWVAGTSSRAGGSIWWWEYRGPDDWVRHDVGTGHTDVGAAAFDANGDGWVDILSGSRLLVNTGHPRTEAFRGYEVGTAYSHDTIAADVDGDGRIDAIANSDRTGLFWYRIPADPTTAWVSHTIAAATQHKVHGGIAPRGAGDVDGDRDTDVVTAGGWYENTDGNGTTWREHRTLDLGTPDKYGLAVRSWLIDLDGDRDLDLVQTEADASDARVAWFENDGKGGWTRHLIRDRGQHQDFHALAVADFDGDGDHDVFSGTAPLTAEGHHACVIWENLAPPGRGPQSVAWREHLVGKMPCHEPAGGDVDGDGDIDVVCKPWTEGNEHVYLRNTRVSRDR